MLLPRFTAQHLLCDLVFDSSQCVISLKPMSVLLELVLGSLTLTQRTEVEDDCTVDTRVWRRTPRPRTRPVCWLSIELKGLEHFEETHYIG